MYKSQLQEYAQKASIPSPVYEFVKEGASHEPRFKASVILNNKTYSSPPGFPNLKSAEHAAAKAALDGLFLTNGGSGVTPSPVHESGLCKNLLQEYAQKNSMPLPVYQSHRSGEDHAPTFTSSVEIAGVRYTGGCGKNKKEAEIKAARTALLAIQSAQPPPPYLMDSPPPQHIAQPVGLATLMSSQMPTSGKRRGRGAAHTLADEPMARRQKTGLQTPQADHEVFLNPGASTPVTPPAPYVPAMTPTSYTPSAFPLPAFSPGGISQAAYYPAPVVIRQPSFTPPVTHAPVTEPSLAPAAVAPTTITPTAGPEAIQAPVAVPVEAGSTIITPTANPGAIQAPVTVPAEAAPMAITPAANPEVIQAPATVPAEAAPIAITPTANPGAIQPTGTVPAEAAPIAINPTANAEGNQAPVTVPAEPAPIAVTPTASVEEIQLPATVPSIPEVLQTPIISFEKPHVDISDLLVIPEAKKILEKSSKHPQLEQAFLTDQIPLFSSPVQGTAILSSSSVLPAEPGATANHASVQEPKSVVQNGAAEEPLSEKETAVEVVQLELVKGSPEAKDRQPMMRTTPSAELISLLG